MPGPSTGTGASRSAPRLLLLEDDRSLREALEAVLAREGYEVASFVDGESALVAVERYRPDAALLDIALAGDTSGFDVAARLRSASEIPLVFLTASDSQADTLRAFDLGADDYVTKPFSLAELLARLRAVLRRSGRCVSGVLTVRDVVVDEQAGAAWRAGRRLDLTPTEFHLLARLARSPGEVLSKVRLLSEVWGFDQFSPNLVEVHMSSLRRKLEENGPRLVYTERGAGYVLRP